MKLRLINLPDMHPCLLWDDILAATVAVLNRHEFVAHYRLSLDVENVPNYESGKIGIEIVPTGIREDTIVKAQRTYEPHRLVELASIAVAGLALFQTGGHQIRDIALRGSSADYLVDEERCLLEVAGRSRRSDFDAAWSARWTRLKNAGVGGFYLCVCEFETPAARLAFAT